jgi:chromosome segregation ATPase
MHLEKAMSDLEKYIDAAKYVYDELKKELESELKDLHEEIRDLKDIRETLQAQNDLLEDQVGELTHAKVFLELELTETTMENLRLSNELKLLEIELDISR